MIIFLHALLRNLLGAALATAFSAAVFSYAVALPIYPQPKTLFDYPIHVLSQIEVSNLPV